MLTGEFGSPVWKWRRYAFFGLFLPENCFFRFISRVLVDLGQFSVVLSCLGGGFGTSLGPEAVRRTGFERNFLNL